MVERMFRGRWSFARLVWAVGLVSLAFAPSSRAGADAPQAPLVVHEWGTFTSVQGTAGIALEGLQHEEEALPDFVYSRSKVRACPLRDKGFKGLEVPANHVTLKMETPVLYFHTSVARKVRVRVDFVGGLISQWYPVSDLLGPPEGACGDGPLDLSKVSRSFLEWDVELLPVAETPEGVPDVSADDPWAFARKVDAAYVRTLPRKAPERVGPVEAEKFLFYRGLGNVRLPFGAGVDAEGRVVFENGSEHSVRHVIALEVSKDAATGRFTSDLDVAPGGRLEPALSKQESRPWREGGVEGLRTYVMKVLMDQGMELDEARAMVETWTRSWFLTEGTRVFYVVPRPLVDAVLPLHIDPAPAKIERVLVGRIELIDPRTQKEVEAALRDIADEVDAQAKRDPARVRRAKDRLDRLGRFLEAHLRHVIATTDDARVRKTAEGLLPKAD